MKRRDFVKNAAILTSAAAVPAVAMGSAAAPKPLTEAAMAQVLEDMLNYEIAKRGAELRRDMERAILFGHTATQIDYYPHGITRTEVWPYGYDDPCVTVTPIP